MNRISFGALFIAPVVLLIAAASTRADVVDDLSSLNPASLVIDFEVLPVGTPEPVIVGGVTISTFNRLPDNNPRLIAAPLSRQTQYPGIFEGHYFAPGNHDFLIEFATPVSQFGMGIHDPNYDGNTLLAFDAMGNLLEWASSAAGDPIFPTGPVGGSHSTFVGFIRPTADIVRVELHNVFNAVRGDYDVLGIDQVRYFAGGGTGVIPEPGSVVLLGIGGLVLGMVWSRKRPTRSA